MANNCSSEERDKKYARLVWLADYGVHRSNMVFAAGRLDRPRTRSGFDALLKEQPDNLTIRFEYTRLALIAGGRYAVRAQFDVTQGKYDPSCWKNSAQFRQALKYAYEDGVNPISLCDSEK